MSTETYRWHYDYSRLVWDTGFSFNTHKSMKNCDRNGIAFLDIERIIRERDVASVEHSIQNILEYNLDSDEARILDPYFIKLFRLSQLAVEYLNYCKRYLDSTITALKKDLQKSTEENNDLKNNLAGYEAEVIKLRKKIKDVKSSFYMNQKFSSYQDTVGSFRCCECKKMFVNEDYLKAHILRRHPNSELPSDESKIDNQINTTPVHSQYKAETDRLQMEIKELKEKLNSTERYFQNKIELVEVQEPKTESEDYYKYIEELHHQFELLKTQIEWEVDILRTQRGEQDKYEQLMEKIFLKIEKGKEPEVEKHKTEEILKIDEQTSTENLQKIEETVDSKDEEKVKEKVEKKVEEKVEEKIEEKVKDKVEKMVLEVDNQQSLIIPDVSKIKEEVEKDLEEKTMERFETFGKQISEKVTSTFEIFQGKLEIFWEKLQEIELDREKQKTLERFISEQSKSYAQMEKVVQVHENISSESSNSETESNRDVKEVIPSSVLKSVEISDKIARNLISELQDTVAGRRNVEREKHVVIRETIEEEECSVESETESESEDESETESETETPVIVKPSKTLTTAGEKSTNTGISTLKNRSISSLENALLANPRILRNLRGDIKRIVDNRLRDLGIDPDFSDISDKTYEKSSDIVAQHRMVATKNNKIFMDIRNNILENLEERVEAKNREKSPRQTQSRKSRIKSLLTTMKDKAKSIIKPEKKLLSPIYKMTVFRSAPNLKEEPTLKGIRKYANKKLILKPASSAPLIYPDSNEKKKMRKTSYKKKVVQSRKAKKKNKMESSMEAEQIRNQDSMKLRNIYQNINLSLDSILEMKKELSKQQNIERIQSVSSIETVDIKTHKNEKTKLESLSETESDNETLQKVQKNLKKKVFFDLHTEKPVEVKTVKTKTTMKANDDSSSIDSSMLELKKTKEISTQALINVSTRKTLDVGSDWDISDI